MNFTLSPEQRQFAATLHDLLREGSGAAARAWGEGEHAAGLALWRKLSGLGLFELVGPEGAGTPIDLVVAFEELGHHATPGPLIETAIAPVLLGEPVSGIVSVAAPHALDADIADKVLLLAGDEIHRALVGERVESVDPTRRLFKIEAAEPVSGDAAAGRELATLLCAAQLLGAGRALLDLSVRHAEKREQFGKPIGSFQAVKHHLANALIALEFARPLLHAAAITPAPRDISAAKIRCGDAAWSAARVAIQVHGAIAYTREYEASLWLTKVAALMPAWGTRPAHLHRLMDSL